MNPFLQMIKPPQNDVPCKRATNLINQASLRIEAIAQHASQLGATLTETKHGSLMIQRGRSSWHCLDKLSAVCVLRGLEMRVGKKGEVAA